MRMIRIHKDGYLDLLLQWYRPVLGDLLLCFRIELFPAVVFCEGGLELGHIQFVGIDLEFTIQVFL